VALLVAFSIWRTKQMLIGSLASTIVTFAARESPR
jgi:hypothetical protein